MSSDGAEARQRLRECEGLVDALLHALHSAVVNGETDNKVSPRFILFSPPGPKPLICSTLEDCLMTTLTRLG